MGPHPIWTISAYGSATAIGVLTIGRSAAMHSNTFVGLMKWVASFSAKGRRQTSQPAR